jgi:hypothetical protein
LVQVTIFCFVLRNNLLSSFVFIIIHNVSNYNSNSTGTTFENYSIKSTSPYHQLNSIGRQPNATPTPKPASPFQRVSGQLDASQIQQQPVKVILSNGRILKINLNHMLHPNIRILGNVKGQIFLLFWACVRRCVSYFLPIFPF